MNIGKIQLCIGMMKKVQIEVKMGRIGIISLAVVIIQSKKNPRIVSYIIAVFSDGIRIMLISFFSALTTTINFVFTALEQQKFGFIQVSND